MILRSMANSHPLPPAGEREQRRGETAGEATSRRRSSAARAANGGGGLGVRFGGVTRLEGVHGVDGEQRGHEAVVVHLGHGLVRKMPKMPRLIRSS